MDEIEEEAWPEEYPSAELVMPTIPITPFMAWADAVQSDGMIEARVVGIRQLADLPDEYEFVVITREEGRLNCVARRHLESDLAQFRK